MLVAILIGSAELLHDNVAQTVVSSVVPDGKLEAANGHFWSIEQMANQLLGPLLGSLLIAVMAMVGMQWSDGTAAEATDSRPPHPLMTFRRWPS